MTTTNDWRETVTGETITDRQVYDYSVEAGVAGDLDAVDACNLAMDGDDDARELVARWYRDAWAACCDD